MKLIKKNIQNILFVIFCILLLVPKTRHLIKQALDTVKVAVWSPSIEEAEDQIEVAPFDYSLENLDGKATAISIGKGSVTFISYWATWCPSCVAEMSSIQSLYDDYRDKVDFILITKEDPAVVKDFMNRKGYNLPAYIPKMGSPELLRSSSIPANYIIDANGKIMIKEIGAANWNSTKVRTLLDDLIGQ